MAVDLLSYTGNANLGLGANADIAAPVPNDSLKEINQTLQQLRNQDYGQNLQLFQQKVNDRDTLREMLAKGVVASGEIDNQDRPLYDEAEKKTIDAFHGIKNINDQKAIEDFYKASKNLTNIVDHAQERNLMLKQLQTDKSNATLPTDQQNIQAFIDSQRKKPFYDRIDPYQKLFSFNTDPINKLYATTSKSYDSEDNLFHFDDVIGDYNQTYKNAQDAYLTNTETAEDMRQLYNKFSNLDKIQLAKSVDAIDKQIDLYNQQTGQNVDHLKVAKADDGTILAIQEPVQDFAAKYALANQPNYLTRASKFNKDFGSYQVDLGELGIKKSRLNAQNAQDYASAANSRASAAKTTEELRQMKDDPEKFNAFDKILALKGAPTKDGLNVVLATKVTPLDLSVIGGFDIVKNENTGVTSIKPKTRFFNPDKNPYILVGTDAGGNQFIRVPSPSGKGNYTDIYRDDVVNQQKLLTTQLGTKGEEIFGKTGQPQPSKDVNEQKAISLSGNEDAKTLKKGQLYNLDGVGLVIWNGKNLVKQK